jgi:hypothetical protein
MTDPVDHALLGLKKVKPKPLRRLTLVHAQSQAKKVVEYLGMSGEPLRAIIHWPIAGQYLIAPRSGTILGSAEALRHWKVTAQDHVFLKQEYRLARARVPLRPERVEGLAKCR